MRTHLIPICAAITMIGCTSTALCAPTANMTVRVKAGRIEEYANGSLRRSFGSKIVDASTDGRIVAAVNEAGRIEEYVNGSLRRSYGTNVVRVRISGGSVFADLKTGRTAEYVNGSLRRTF